MEKIEKDGKVIAVVGNEEEAFWKNQVENTKLRISNLKNELKFWEVILKASEREFLKAQRNYKPE